MKYLILFIILFSFNVFGKENEFDGKYEVEVVWNFIENRVPPELGFKVGNKDKFVFEIRDNQVKNIEVQDSGGSLNSINSKISHIKFNLKDTGDLKGKHVFRFKSYPNSDLDFYWKTRIFDKKIRGKLEIWLRSSNLRVLVGDVISLPSEIENPETKVVSPVLSNSMDGEYMLFWRQIGKRSKAKTESITDIVVDIVTIKHGELNFVKLTRDFKIQQEHREKIIFKLKEDHFIITGKLDLNTARKTQPVYIKGSNKPNDKGQYIAETVYEKRDDREKILQVVLQPIFNEKEAAKVCLYHAGSVTECQRHITCSYEDNIYTCSREYEKVESQCTYVDGIYSCNGKVIDVFAQKKADEEKKRKEKKLAAKKKKEEEAKKLREKKKKEEKAQELAAKKKKEEEEAKKKAQELAAKKKKEEEEAKKKAQELAAKKKKEAELKQKLSKKIQELLSILGFYKGSIDGIFDQESLQALNEWRMAKNLNKVLNIDEINEKELLLLENNTNEFIQNKKKEELAKKKEEEERKRKELVRSNKERQLAQIYISDLLAFVKIHPNEFDIITLSELMVSNKDILEDQWDNKLQNDFDLLKEYTKTVDIFVQFLKEQEINRKEILLTKIASEDLKIQSFINNAKNYLQNNITSSLAPEILKQIKLADKILNTNTLDVKKEFNKNIIVFINESELGEILEIETDIASDTEDIYKADIIKVQKNLKDLGYYTGSIDGNFGEESLRSLNQWAKENNLEMLLSIDGMNEEQFNLLQEKTIEFVKKQKETDKLKLEKSDDQKRLAQIYINDLIDFIKSHSNEFDIITLSELMVSNKDILEGKWDNKLQNDFELLEQYTLKSLLFEKFHLSQNENRQNQLIAKINELNDNISDIINYFKFYLQNNMTSILLPEILKEIKNAEKGINIQDIEVKRKYITDLTIFIESKKLNEDFFSFLDSIKSQEEPTVNTSKADEAVNNNKLSNIDFIKNIGGSDLIILANLSGKAPNAILNLSGEIIFENNEAISCFYQSKEILKNKRFYYYDKIPERKFLINSIDLECKQNKLLSYDLIFFIKDDLMSENQEYVSELIRQIQSDNMRFFNVVTIEQYENDILERKNFAKQIKKDVIEGVRLGYGSVAIKNNNTTLCSDIKDNQATHKSIINLLQNEFMRLGYGKIVEMVSFKDKEKTWIDVQRGRCGFLYVGQDSFQDFIKGFEKAKTEYEIMPIWYSPSQIAREQERLDQLENQRLIDLQKKKEENEKKELLEKEKLESVGKIKNQQQELLREKNRNIVKSHVDLIEEKIKAVFVEIEKKTNEDTLDDPDKYSSFYYDFEYFSEFLIQRYHEGWVLDHFDLNPEDYGMGVYRNRKINTYITRLTYKLRNDDVGDYFPQCLIFGMMHDKEFKRYREPFISNCEEKIKRDNKGYKNWDRNFNSWNELNKYKKRHSFESEWIVK